MRVAMVSGLGGTKLIRNARAENFWVRVHAKERVHARARQGIHALYRSTHKKIYNFVQLEQLHLPLFVIVSLPLFCPLSPTTVL